MDGRWRRGQSLPGMPAELYDLFPDRLVDSELGEIPAGWEVSEIGREVEVVGGSTASTKVQPAYWDGRGYPLGNSQRPFEFGESGLVGNGEKD